MKFVYAVILGYMIGSISFGIIVTKLFLKTDIRTYGSGNAGVTNVLRAAGKGPAAIVLVGDILKGALSVYIGLYFGDNLYAVAAGLAAMAGHSYPLYFGFKGGKGVATGCGVILALVPDVTIIAASIFVLTIIITRYVSLGSLLGALSVPIDAILFAKPMPIIILCFLAAGFVIIRHRTNIIRLYHGNENKFMWKRDNGGVL